MLVFVLISLSEEFGLQIQQKVSCVKRFNTMRGVKEAKGTREARAVLGFQSEKDNLMDKF